MNDDLAETMRDAADAAVVLGFRVPMLMMTPTPARRREAERMVAEKAEAAFEGALAWQAYWWRAAMTPWTVGPSAASEAAAAFAAPGRKTLRANARRLGRRKTL